LCSFFAILLCALLSSPVDGGVSLSEVYAKPGAHLGATRKLRFQFQGQVHGWNPYMTRFGPAEWSAFEVWGDELLLWERVAFENHQAGLFARKGSEAERVLSRARMYQRFEVRARVSEVFLGQPWIEILDVRPLEEMVGEGTLLHAQRALELLQEKSYVLAREQFQRAMVPNLPEHARLALERLADHCESQSASR
jgi:hypothetical protein